MDSKPIWMAAGLTAAALLTALPGAQAGNCNNYGIAVTTYIYSQQDCSSHEYVQYCDQGTGAGAGAGAGSGYGDGEAGAAATAGTKCEQNNGGNSTSSESGRPVGGPVADSLVPGTSDGTAAPYVDTSPVGEFLPEDGAEAAPSVAVQPTIAQEPGLQQAEQP